MHFLQEEAKDVGLYPFKEERSLALSEVSATEVWHWWVTE